MTSAFDPDLILNQQTNESNDTTYTPVPEKECRGVIDSLTPRTAGDKPVFEVKWIVDDDEARQVTGVEKPMVKQTIWLDLTAQGGLDMGKGKNVGLGKLREALGQNQPGKPWMPGMLVGGVAMISIKHRAGKEPGEIFADVKAVTAL